MNPINPSREDLIEKRKIEELKKSSPLGQPLIEENGLKLLTPAEASRISEIVKASLSVPSHSVNLDAPSTFLINKVKNLSAQEMQEIPEDTLLAFSADTLLLMPKETLESIPLTVQEKILKALEDKFPHRNKETSKEYMKYQDLSKAFYTLNSQRSSYVPPLDLHRQEPLSDDELKNFSQEQAQQISAALKNPATVAGKKVKDLLEKISQKQIATIPIESLESLSIEALSLISKESLSALGSDSLTSLIKAMYKKIPVNENGDKDTTSSDWNRYIALRAILSSLL